MNESKEISEPIIVANEAEKEYEELSKRYNLLLQKFSLIEHSIKTTEQKINEIQYTKNPKELQASPKEKFYLSNQRFLSEIQSNKDLSDFYNSFLREVESIYIGARVLQSGKFDYNSDDSLLKAASYTKEILDKIPLIGEIIYMVFNEVVGLFETYKKIEGEIKTLNVGQVAPDVQTFDEFCEAIAVKILKNKEKIILDLKRAKIENNSFKNICKSAIEKGVSGIMEIFLKEDDSQAEVLGKAEALKVIAYFQKGYIKLKPNEDFTQHVDWVVEKKIPNSEEKNLNENTKNIEQEESCCYCNLL